MSNDLTPLKYHKRNILSLSVTLIILLCAIVFTMVFEGNDNWAELKKIPVMAAGAFLFLSILLFYQYKKINISIEYQAILDKASSKAFWKVLIFLILINPIIQIPMITEAICAYSGCVKYYFLMQAITAVLIREVIVFKLLSGKRETNRY